MKLSVWARQQGVDYKTALRWFHEGHLPVPARQLATGTILVEPEPFEKPELAGSVVVYARVSASDQSDDLDRQVGRLVGWAQDRNLDVAKVVKEVGSGMNGKRRKLVRLLADPNATTVVVEHRDRLARFGFDYIEAALAGSGRRIVIVDDGEVDDDLVWDVTEVLTSLCARLYGRRSAKRRVEAALSALAAG